jgi:hypothetical protein
MRLRASTATARVYCHRFEQALPEDAEIVEQTPSSSAVGIERRSTSCSTAPGFRVPSSSLRR